MKICHTALFITQQMRLGSAIAMLLVPLTVFGQELGEPLIGPEILAETVQIEHNSFANCALQNTGSVFCWRKGPRVFNSFENLIPNLAGFSALNTALNNDIASITLDSVNLCGIGKESGIACVPADGRDFSANGSVQFPPEPDASYLSISGLLNFPAVCAIQTDNRVVCWGSTFIGSDNVGNVPPEAAYLQQVDVESSRACGIDLNNALVCWGRPTLNAGVDAHFGDIDIATIGPVKQVSMGRLGACLIDMNDKLECFGNLNGFTDILSQVPLSSIEVGGTSFFSPNVLCYETTSGEKDCQALTSSEGSSSSESILTPDAVVRLTSLRNGVCYVTADEAMKCTLSGGLPAQNQFPTAPQNLSIDLYSDTQGELSWVRPSEDLSASDFATGYEIFRDGVLIARLPIVTSYYDSNTNPNASYEVRAIRGLIAGTSSYINADGSIGPALPVVPTTPTPTTPAVPGSGTSEIELTGAVYSTTALELFYNIQAGNSAVRYNILRDGIIIRENSPATSQFEAGLDVNTTYVYEVEAVLDGSIIAAQTITLTTLDDGSGPVSPIETTGVSVDLSGAVYSSAALELFWNRASVAGVTYNVFRDGVLVRQNTPATSHFDAQLSPNNTFVYEVVALLDGDVVASTSIEINPSVGSVSVPITPVSPVAPTVSVAPIELNGAVYSSTALELSWNRDALPGVTYNIFRDGELIRENSPAVSQFEAGLLPNTRYVYTVTPLLNGVEQVSDTIELSTFGT